MNILGLRHSLDCQLLIRDLLNEVPIVRFPLRSFPQPPGPAATHEHVVFETVRYMTFHHLHHLGKERFVAKLTLRNEETGESLTSWTKTIAVDLAAEPRAHRRQ